MGSVWMQFPHHCISISFICVILLISLLATPSHSSPEGPSISDANLPTIQGITPTVVTLTTGETTPSATLMVTKLAPSSAASLLATTLVTSQLPLTTSASVLAEPSSPSSSPSSPSSQLPPEASSSSIPSGTSAILSGEASADTSLLSLTSLSDPASATVEISSEETTTLITQTVLSLVTASTLPQQNESAPGRDTSQLLAEKVEEEAEVEEEEEEEENDPRCLAFCLANCTSHLGSWNDSCHDACANVTGCINCSKPCIIIEPNSETVSWTSNIVHHGPQQLEWTAQSNSIHVLQKMSSSSSSWHTIAMTPKSSISLSDLDFCKDQLRISAVNGGGVGTVWKPILTNKLRLPAVRFVAKNYSKGSGEVFINISWRAPESWEEVVKTYSVSASAHPRLGASSFHRHDILKEVNGTSTMIRLPLNQMDDAVTLSVKTTVMCLEGKSKRVTDVISPTNSGPETKSWFRLPSQNLTISSFIKSYPSSSHPGSYSAMVAWGKLTFSQMTSLMLFWGEATETTFPGMYSFQQNTVRNITLSLNATSFMITSLKPESMYGVELVAALPKGARKPAFPIVLKPGQHTKKIFSTGEMKVPTTTPATTTRPTIMIKKHLPSHKLSIYIVVPVAVGLVLAFLTFCLVGIFRRHSNSSKASLSRDEESIPNIYSSPSYPALLSSCQVKPDVMDRWEISPARIKVGDVLGEGAFGQVLKGLVVGRIWSHQSSLSAIVPREAAHGEHTVVAVKMLHKYAEDTQKQEFLREIELMKELGYHPNVVSLIGCCTIQDPICLLVEHCYYGDLLHYLRNRRSQIFDQFKTGRAPRTPCKDTLRPLDLLSFARQIAMGMEYISQKGFVHRDLAARNVMVADDKNVKIGDFGLTRYVYDDKVYVNRRGGKLPVKWMSIEAIYDQVFTTKGDVWSYGVVLFEIMTLGAAPYPGTPNKDMPKLLKGGYRMEKPENCSPEIFSIMQSCWRDDPEAREGFTQLRNRLEEMMEQDVCYMEFDSEKQQCFYYSSSSSSSEDEDSIVDGLEVEAEESPMLESSKLEMMRDGHLATPMLKIPSGCANTLQSRSTLNLSHMSPCKPSTVVSISLNSLDHSKQTELPWLPSDTITFGRNIDNRAYYAGHLSTSDDAMAQNSIHIQGEGQSSENPYSGVIGSLEGVHGNSVPIFAHIQAGSLQSRDGSTEEHGHTSGECSQDSDSCIGDENSSDEEHHHMIKDFVQGGDLFDSSDMSPDDVQCIQYPPLIALKHCDEGKQLISPTSLDSGVSCDMATSKLMMDACMEVHPTSLADSTV